MPRFTVSTQEEGNRLDVCVCLLCEDLTRSRIQTLIKEGLILVDGKPAKANLRLKKDQVIDITIPLPRETEILPQAIDLDVVYEDNDIIVINKPRGMVVHPAPGNWDGTLVNALLDHCTDLSGIGGEIRPGIVHRIDKDTTGLLVIAKNDAAHNNLAAQISAKTAKRTYLALVEGVLTQDDGQIDAPIGRDHHDRLRMAVVEDGRNALTSYQVEKRYAKWTLLRLELSTGRTHQIRVHMAHIGHPVVGDPVYGYRKQKFHLQGQMLHAAQLTLVHPTTGQTMSFSAPLPEDFSELLKKLDSVSSSL